MTADEPVEGRVGDRPGYFLSEQFWMDRYRSQIVGGFTTRETIRARIAKAALELEQKYADEDMPLGVVERLEQRP